MRGRVDRSAPHSLSAGLHVADLERSEAFFVDVVGCQVFGRLALPAGRLTALRFGNSMLKLLEWEASREAEARREVYGIRYLTFHVENVDEVVELAQASGHCVSQAPYAFSDTVRVAMLADPDGNTVELCRGVAWEPATS